VTGLAAGWRLCPHGGGHGPDRPRHDGTTSLRGSRSRPALLTWEIGGPGW
jgi:hypothetical protein